MRVTLLSFILILFAHISFSQEIDLLRLGYSANEVSAQQIGLAVSPDRKNIAFVYNDQTVKIFDTQANRFIKKFKGPYTALFDVQLTSTNGIIFITEQEVQLWNWKEERFIEKFILPSETTKTAFLGSKDLLAVGQKEGITTIFDMKAVKKIQEINRGKHHVGALAFHPNGNTIAIAVITGMNFNPNPVALHEISTGKEKVVSTESGYYTMFAFNETGDELVTAGLRKTTQSFTEVLDGNTLVLKRTLTKEVNWTNAGMPYGALYANNKLMAITLAQSFNVSDGQSGTTLFTTKSDKVKMPAVFKIGVGAFNVFPLTAKADRVLLNATKNNINQIYDAQTNSIVGYFFSDSNDDFAIVSRDGKVDGTAGALSKVFWTSRNSTNKTSLESTFEKSFTPKLFSQILITADKEQVDFPVDNVVSKIPVLQITSINNKPYEINKPVETTQKVSTISLKVMTNPMEVADVKLYQNTKFVKSLPNNGSNMYTFDISLTTSFGEENYFYAVASSKSGVDSEKAKCVITYKGVSEERPRLFLVTIGINQYKNPKYNLNYALADADGFEATLRKSSATLFKEIIPFTIRNDKAIKENITGVFEQIRSKALEQDMLIVYYAGHGVMTEPAPDQQQEFFIVPHDITQLYGKNELLQSRGISATTLKDFASSVNAQKQVFILDACQSAGALEAMANRGAAEEKAIAQLARSTGTFWITATGSEQFAAEFEKLGHGIFTYLLLEGLNGSADTNQDKKLTVRELSTYIENKVPELSEELKGVAQYPSAYSFGNDFPILIYK